MGVAFEFGLFWVSFVVWILTLWLLMRVVVFTCGCGWLVGVGFAVGCGVCGFCFCGRFGAFCRFRCCLVALVFCGVGICLLCFLVFCGAVMQASWFGLHVGGVVCRFSTFVYGACGLVGVGLVIFWVCGCFCVILWVGDILVWWVFCGGCVLVAVVVLLFWLISWVCRWFSGLVAVVL